MARAWNALRRSPVCRRETFDAGLVAAGFELLPRIDTPERGDVYLCWNRYEADDEQARRFEAVGAKVLVIENGHLGKRWNGEQWLAIAKGHHCGAGSWSNGDGSRWDSFHVEPAPWRRGRETVILGQRGYGEAGVRCPDKWAEEARQRFGGRIRPHPGTEPAKALADDLDDAGQAITWNSGAALLALLHGVPVWYEFDRWIGARAALPVSSWGTDAKRDDAARLAMFRRLAWAMWTPAEVESGEALRAVLA